MSSKYITVDDTQATSLAEAKILAKQHEGLHWKVHRKNPGVRGTTAIFQCNSHVNCPRLLRVACIQGVYHLQREGRGCGIQMSAVTYIQRYRRLHTVHRNGVLLISPNSGDHQRNTTSAVYPHDAREQCFLCLR